MIREFKIESLWKVDKKMIEEWTLELCCNQTPKLLIDLNNRLAICCDECGVCTGFHKEFNCAISQWCEMEYEEEENNAKS